MSKRKGFYKRFWLGCILQAIWGTPWGNTSNKCRSLNIFLYYLSARILIQPSVEIGALTLNSKIKIAFPLLMVSVEDLFVTWQLLALRHPKMFKKSRDNKWNIGHFVAACGTVHVMKDLLQTYPQLYQSVTLDGKTPLQLAFEHNNMEVVRLLVLVLTKAPIN